MIKRLCKRFGRWLRWNWRVILDCVLICVILIAFFAGGFAVCLFVSDYDAAIWKTIATAEEPERCSLCKYGTGVWYHAPCLVNLHTGEVGELTVYNPDHTKVGEIAEEQPTGFFSFVYCAGVTAWRDADDRSCHATLPEELEPMNAAYFCYDCRRLLADTDRYGYVLADLHDLDNITAYLIEDGAEYTIRDYVVTVSEDENRRLAVDVTGLLYRND